MTTLDNGLIQNAEEILAKIGCEPACSGIGLIDSFFIAPRIAELVKDL